MLARPSVSRRRFLGIGGVTSGAALVCKIAASPSARLVSNATFNALAPASSSSGGEWSAPVKVNVMGMHAVLLRTGRILLYEYVKGVVGSNAQVIDPVTGALYNVTIPFQRDVNCSSASVLPDGRILVVGGSGYPGKAHQGTRNLTLFDPFSQKWSDGGLMNGARWYPTSVQMPDGTTLILTGEPAKRVLTKTMESYNPATGVTTLLPESASSDADLYSMMFVMPSGKVFRAGPDRNSGMFDPISKSWAAVADMNFGRRYGGTAVLLPGLTKVLTLGGANTSLQLGSTVGATGTASAEIINLSEPAPAWRNVKPMRYARVNPNAVLLPDGTVLVVGGSRQHQSTDPVHQAELFDPATGRWSRLASQAADRSYHATAMLLPDGRVMSAGSNFGNSPTTIEYFSPPYLLQGSRPTLASAPESVTYGGSFQVSTPDALDIAKVALMRPASVTHGNNFEQRNVACSFTRASGTLTVQAPSSRNVAPPGYYMLFLVNSKGVPATARFVRVA